jgi:hypothetical protein
MVTALDALAVAGAIGGLTTENNFGDTRSGGLAGPMGLLIIVLMAIATVLLIRNMNARLRRLPDRFPNQEADETPNGEDHVPADGDDPAPSPESGARP